MAIPLIIGVGLAAAGLYKGGKAIIDNNDANTLNENAREIVERAQKKLDSARVQCEAALQDLGHKKVDTLATNVKDFLTTFEQIKNVDFEHDGDLGNLNLKEFSTDVLLSMQKQVSFVISSGLGAGTGLAGGALTAFGAYSGTMAFAAAGTGTAISSLSGAAATNATLAWLGGGTLASGGMGVAGGMMALGALTAGPALLIAGWYMGSKAEGKLNDAHSNLTEARRFQTDIEAAIALTEGIRSVAKRASNILSLLRKHSRRNLKRLQKIIDDHGTDYSMYEQDAKLIVLKNVKLMQLIKAVLDTPILDEQGNLMGDADSNLLVLHDQIQEAFPQDLKA
ncbi:hypothetical protein [Neisseria sp. CCUG12390]|uniref:hypothetical protein n=1 Tax=Neisseria sp. CCUG12390 TaxID=3392035 RepID=UPI003A0FD4EF